MFRHFEAPQGALIWASLQAAVFLVFGFDKICAVAFRSRVPNAWLRALAVCAGPGALAAMVVFRHKIRYPSMLLLSVLSSAGWAWWIFS